MLIVISPAKSLDFKTPSPVSDHTIPAMLNDSEKLAGKLKELDFAEISKLMKISNKLAYLNYERFQTWHTPFTPKNAKQALFAFSGDVYTGIEAAGMNKKQVQTAQKKLRILSGLYGILKPLDLIQPYRLEMGTKFRYNKAKDLYDFWSEKITKEIQRSVSESGSNILVNLASNEYFRCINTKNLNAEIISPVFKDMKNGQYKIISFFAKKARGLMTRFIIDNDIDDADKLLAFESDGYIYNPRMSTPSGPVFTRG